MASPQKENGYVPIANETIEHLARLRLNGEAMQVLWVVLRKTYGFNKKEDAIALSQFVEATGLRKPDICRALNKLNSMGIVSKKANGVANKYVFIKDYELWRPLAKKLTLAIKPTSVSNKAKNRWRKSDIQKTITKDNATKDREKVLEPPKIKSEIVQVIDLFKEINPSFALYFGRPPQRESALRLFKTHGIEKLTNVIGYVKANRGERYIPTIQSPYDLEEKWAKLESFAKREHTSKNNFII